MVLITHVISIPLSHMKRTPSVIPNKRSPVIPDKKPPPVIPDVRNRESRVFLAGLFLHGASDNYSEVMLALSKEYDSLIEPWGKTVLTGFPLKTAGMTEGGLRA